MIISRWMHLFSFAVVLLYISEVIAAPVKVTKTHALTLLESPKYPRGFKHLNYVNPQAPKGGVFSMIVSGGFDSFNPFITQGNPSWSIDVIYDTLLSFSADEPYTAYGLVAESIELPEDNSWVAFNIHPQARFHDGKPMTADDLVFTLNILRKHGQPFYKQAYAEVESVTATSAKRVLYTFKHPGQRKLPFLIGQLPVLPKHFWEDPAHDFSRGNFDIPLGSSAYRVSGYKAGHQVTYERVKDYWASNHPLKVGRHNFDKLVYDYYRDNNVAFEAFKKGDYGFHYELISKNWYTSYTFPAIQRGDIIAERIKTSESWGMNSFAFNTRRPHLRDPRVRRALILAYDFESLNKNMMYSEYERTNSYFVQTAFAASGLPSAEEIALLEPFRNQLPAELFTSPYTLPVTDGAGNNRQFLNQAAKLLKEAGFEKKNNQLINPETGTPVVLDVINPHPQIESTLVAYKKHLAKLGIELTIKTIDSSQFLHRIRDFNFDLANWVYDHERMPGKEMLSQFGSEGRNDTGSLNISGINSPVVDYLIMRTEQAKTMKELQTIVRALDRVLLWGNYVIPKWNSHKGERIARRKELKHLPIDGLNWVEVSSWWYEPD